MKFPLHSANEKRDTHCEPTGNCTRYIDVKYDLADSIVGRTYLEFFSSNVIRRFLS